MDTFKSRGKPYSIFVSHIPDNPIILEIGGEKLGIAPIPYISHRKYRALTGRSDYGAFLRKEINRLLSEMHNVDFKVLMAHLLVRGCRFTDTYVERYSDEPQIPVDYLYPEEFDYIALGHAHLNQRIRDNAHYAGSIERIDFSEIDDEKYFNLVDLSDGDVERINLLCRKMYSFDLSLQPQVDILALFKDQLSKLNGIKGAIIRLKVYGNRHSLKKFDKLLPRIDKVMLDDYGVAAYSYVKEPLFLGRRPRIDAEKLTPIRLKDVARTFISNRYRDRGKIVLNRAYSLLDEVLGEEDEADRS
jgi:DNA repair exonuclease SbcCD nuclease subunit